MAAARRHYRAYVKACVMEDDRPLLEAMAGSRYAIGGAEFEVESSGLSESRMREICLSGSMSGRRKRSMACDS